MATQKLCSYQPHWKTNLPGLNSPLNSFASHLVHALHIVPTSDLSCGDTCTGSSMRPRHATGIMFACKDREKKNTHTQTHELHWITIKPFIESHALRTVALRWARRRARRRAFCRSRVSEVCNNNDNKIKYINFNKRQNIYLFSSSFIAPVPHDCRFTRMPSSMPQGLARTCVTARTWHERRHLFLLFIVNQPKIIKYLKIWINFQISVIKKVPNILNLKFLPLFYFLTCANV